MGVKLIVKEKHYIDGSFKTKEYQYKVFDKMSDKLLNEAISRIYVAWNKYNPYDTKEVVRVEKVITGKGNWRTKRTIY